MAVKSRLLTNRVCGKSAGSDKIRGVYTTLRLYIFIAYIQSGPYHLSDTAPDVLSANNLIGHLLSHKA